MIPLHHHFLHAFICLLHAFTALHVCILLYHLFPRTILILDCHHDLARPEGNGSNGKSILLSPSPIHLSAYQSGEYFVQVHLRDLLGGLFIRFGKWLSPTKQGITEITVKFHSSSYYSFFSSFFLTLCFLLYFSSSKHALSHWVGVWVCGLHCKQLRFVVMGCGRVRNNQP
jgi:hypothetical protein